MSDKSLYMRSTKANFNTPFPPQKTPYNSQCPWTRLPGGSSGTASLPGHLGASHEPASASFLRLLHPSFSVLTLGRPEEQTLQDTLLSNNGKGAHLTRGLWR